jgi:ABC-type dipeptide/oligopeptide/nickel transport system ATPase component
MAVLFVTHDLSLALGFSDEVAVFYAGGSWNGGPRGTLRVARASLHPGFARVPALAAEAGKPLPTLAGVPPESGRSIVAALSRPAVHGRKTLSSRRTREVEVGKEHHARCFYPSVR